MDIQVPASVLDKFDSEFKCFMDAETSGVNLDLLQYAVWLRNRIETDAALLLLLHSRQVTVTHFDRDDPAASTLDRIVEVRQ
jgi:hypothetical protein